MRKMVRLTHVEIIEAVSKLLSEKGLSTISVSLEHNCPLNEYYEPGGSNFFYAVAEVKDKEIKE